MGTFLFDRSSCCNGEISIIERMLHQESKVRVGNKSANTHSIVLNQEEHAALFDRRDRLTSG